MKFKNEDVPKTKKPFRVIGGITVKYYGEEYTGFQVGKKEFKVKGGNILAAFKQAEAEVKRNIKGQLDRARRKGTVTKRGHQVSSPKEVHNGRKQKRKAV